MRGLGVCGIIGYAGYAWGRSLGWLLATGYSDEFGYSVRKDDIRENADASGCSNKIAKSIQKNLKSS